VFIMASVTKTTEGNQAMADPQSQKVEDRPAPEKAPPPAKEKDKDQVLDYRGPSKESREPRGPGFFTIHKKGQGYWTRMLTAAGALAIDVLVSNFIYSQLRAYLSVSRTTALSIATAVFVVIAVFAWRIMNKPGPVDFLIATDSEMKKVNWTTRKELIGSTKVVIFFVFLISAILFVIDVLFGFLFYAIRVLDVPPF
jgi:preprotein translocase SecE subunit